MQLSGSSEKSRNGNKKAKKEGKVQKADQQSALVYESKTFEAIIRGNEASHYCPHWTNERIEVLNFSRKYLAPTNQASSSMQSSRRVAISYLQSLSIQEFKGEKKGEM